MVRFNLKHFLDYASQVNPNAVKNALQKTARKREMSGLGDFISDLPVLDTSFSTLDWATPSEITVTATPSFNGSTQVSVSSDVAGKSIGDSIMDFFNNLTKSAPELLTAYTAIKQLDACTKTNQARLSQGLPPIDCAAFSPQVQVGIAPNTQGIVNLALIGGGLLLVWLIMRK